MDKLSKALQLLQDHWQILLTLIILPVRNIMLFVIDNWRTRKALDEYRKNAGKRYNNCGEKILFNEGRKNAPQLLFSEDKTDVFYVPTTIKYGKSEPIHNANVDDLLKISYRLFIEGESGSGKSIFARYLAADAARHKRNGKKYCPILLELSDLRRPNNPDGTKPGQNEFLTVLLEAVNHWEKTLEEQAFKRGLKRGDYLIILDGLDMLQNLGDWQKEMRDFFESYLAPPCFITMRSSFNPPLLYSFYKTAHIEPLDEIRARKLAEILDKDNRSAHGDDFYASMLKYGNKYWNYPLTLGMFYTVFCPRWPEWQQRKRLPRFKVEELRVACFNEFYRQAKKRNKLNCALNLEQYKRLFSAFCFDTFPKKTEIEKPSSTEEKSKYDITEESVKENLRRRLEEWGWEVDAGRFLSDLCDEIYMLKRLPQQKYEFPHTSFQTYFAAYYLKLLNGDEKDAEARKILRLSYWDRRYFYQYLMGIDNGPFMKDVIHKGLREIWETMKREPDDFERQIILLKTVFCGVTVTDFREERQTQPQYDYWDLIYYFQTYQGLEDGFRLSSLLEVFREFAAKAQIPDGNIEPDPKEDLSGESEYGQRRFEYRRIIGEAVAKIDKIADNKSVPETGMNSEWISRQISLPDKKDKNFNDRINNAPPLYRRCRVDGNKIQGILLFEDIDNPEKYTPKERDDLYNAILKERRIPEIWDAMRKIPEIEEAMREEAYKKPPEVCCSPDSSSAGIGSRMASAVSEAFKRILPGKGGK